MPASLTLSTTTVDAVQHETALSALRSQRERLASLLRGLDEDEWTAQSRCTEWRVHEVVRHLGDATLRVAELLRGELPKDTLQFDPRTTPSAWLASSAGERPHETRRRLDGTTAALLGEVDRHVREGTDAHVPFLYGQVPWSVAVLHAVWDAWVHERDIVLPLRRPHDAPADESRVVAAYALALAGTTAVMLQGTELDERCVLTGNGGGTFSLEVSPGGTGQQFTVTSSTTVDAGDDALRGDLADVVDSLVGRDPSLTHALQGPPERVERLGMFRAFMLLPTS